MKRPLLVADLFCGAGGSSTGAQRALARLGHRMDLLCVNHWPVAAPDGQRRITRAYQELEAEVMRADAEAAPTPKEPMP